MKKIFFIYSIFIAACLTSLSTSAQEELPKLSSITLHVSDPKVSETVNEVHISSLVTKIENIVTEAGLASSDYSNNFVIEPKFIVTNSQKSAGGMRSVVVADCNFSLTVKQQNSGAIFSQYARSFKGSGFSDAEAVTNAISQIDASDEKAVAFIAKAKEKIIAYYKQNCDVLMQKSAKDQMVKNYESSLAILLTIPEEAQGCYGKAQAKAATVFKEMQNYQCKKFILQAQTYAANKDYDNALETLSWIDPTGTCTAEAKNLIKKIDAETSDDKKKQWQYVFKALDGTIEIGKARAAAMNAYTAYWLRQQGNRTVIVN